ncbi:MAG: metallophosphoesterase [Candidatus Hydrogenedentota bacterium]
MFFTGEDFMIIGIMADSHDNLNLLERVLDVFNNYKAGYVLHCGDYIAPFTSRVLGRLKVPFFGVFGNNDGEKNGLVKMFSNIGPIVNQPGEIIISDKKFILFHEPRDNYDGYNTDIICFGHTHTPLIEEIDNKLIINPGECGGWVSGKPSVAVFDTIKNIAEVVYL